MSRPLPLRERIPGNTSKLLRERVLRRWRWIAALLPGLVLAGWFLLDSTIDPLTLPALVIDRALQIAVLLAVPAIVAALTASSRTAQFCLLYAAAALGALALTVLATGALRPPADTTAMLVAGLGALGAGFVLFAQGARSEKMRRVPVLVGAAVAAALIPALQFWQAAVYLPSAIDPALIRQVNSTVVEATSSRFTTAVRDELSNPTDTRMLVILSRRIICYWRDNAELATAHEKAGGELEVADYLKLDNCSSSEPFGRLSWVSPTASLVSQELQEVPRGAPLLQVMTSIAYARGDRLRTSQEPQKVGRLGACTNVEQVRLDEESRYKSVAQPEKILQWADRNGDGGINYSFTNNWPSSCAESSDLPAVNELSRYFGVTQSKQELSFWLVEPKPPETT